VTAWLPLEESAIDLYEHAPCGYLSLDPDWLILRVNQTFLDWTGYRSDDLVGVKRLPDLLSVGGRIYHETHVAPLLRMQDELREIAGDVVCAGGRRMPTLFNAVLKRDERGEPLLIRATVFDATDRRRYELELLSARDRERAARRQTEQLEGLSRELVAAADTAAVAQAVGAELVASFDATRIGVAVRDEEGMLRPLFGHGGDGPIPRMVTAPAFEEGERCASARLPLGTEAPLGVMWVAYDEPHTFTAEERELLIASAGQATLALERSRLYETQRDVAHVLQQSMLGGRARSDRRYDVATFYEPSAEHMEVGGDWYDTFDAPEGRVAIVIGDVVGRGLVAASAMGQLRSAVRAIAATGRGPAGVLGLLDAFVAQVPAAQYATLVYAEVDVDDGEMRFACAGHLPPLLWERGAAPRLLMEGRSPPLGSAYGGAPRAEAVVTLPPDALLLLYTDGLVERRGELIDDGLDRLVSTVAESGQVDPAALVARLEATLLGPGADDDVCMLCFARRG
jgi:serine/threonine-protein kinase RsbW